MTPTDQPRHPLCAPTNVRLVGHAQDFAAQQATEIVRLDGALANARARTADLERDYHDLANRVTKAEGALDMLAPLVGLPAGATPRQVVEAVIARLK